MEIFSQIRLQKNLLTNKPENLDDVPTVEPNSGFSQKFSLVAVGFARSAKSSWAVFLIALIVRMLYLLQATDNPFLYVPQLDEEFYVNFGKGLLKEDSSNMDHGFFMDPLYGYFLGGIFYLFGDNLFVPRLIQVLADSLSALLLCLIGRKLWSPSAGLIAGLIYAAYPVCWFYSLTLLKTTFTTNYAILFSFLLIIVLERQNLKNWFMFGILTGIGVYLRGNLILLLPFTMFLPIINRKDSWRVSIRMSAGYVFGAAIILGSVGVINKVDSNQFSMLPSTGGITLYGANNPENLAGENSNPKFITKSHPADLFIQYKAEAEQRLGNILSNSEVSAYWRSQAVKYWFSSPTVLPSLMWHKFRHLISHSEIANNQSLDIAARFAPMLLPQIPFFSLILAAGLPGLLLAIRKDSRVFALLPVVGVVVVTTLIYFSSSRFRLPLVPILILGGAYLMSNYWFGAVNYKKSVLVAVVALIFFISFYIDGPPSNVLQQEINLALAHAEIGQISESVSLVQNLEKDYNDNNYYQKIRGYISLLAKDYKSAYYYSRLALDDEPNDYGTMGVAGIAALELNNSKHALDLFTLAYSISKDAEFHYWIGRSQVALGNTVLAEQHLQQALKLLDQFSPISIQAKKQMKELQSN